jgi:Zn-dependent protease
LNELQQFLLMAPVLLFSMVAHEYAHGYAALKQGDPTAYQLGRLTWNPLKHIDPFLTVILPILTFFGGGFIFGGAKPVPVVARNYRNYRRGDIIVSMAGIVTNLALAVCCTLLFVVLGLLGRVAPGLTDSLALLQFMMRYGIIINLVLAMFNLLPIPPLDGSHVMKYLLPPTWSLRYQRLGMYGIFVLMLLMATGIGRPIFNVWMAPVTLALAVIFRSLGAFVLPSQFLMGL